MQILKPLEKDIEQAFLRKLKKAYPHIRALKFSAIGQRSWPDRILFLSEGRVLLIEFKRPGGLPTELQEECHKYLRDMGHDIQVFSNAEEAFNYVKGRVENG